MVTKTKEPPAEEAVTETETTTEDKVSLDDPAFIEKVAKIVREVLGSTETTTEETTTETEKRLSPRDEEERTRSIVAEAIAAFKKQLPDGGETEDKSEPEKVPATSTLRWIEKKLWGVE